MLLTKERGKVEEGRAESGSGVQGLRVFLGCRTFRGSPPRPDSPHDDELSSWPAGCACVRCPGRGEVLAFGVGFRPDPDPSTQTQSALRLKVKTLGKETSLKCGFYKQGCLSSAEP